MDQIDTFYHCAYHYVETAGVGIPAGVDDYCGWYYPDLQLVIAEMQQKFDKAKIPLRIEVQDKRIIIRHKNPSIIGSLAQLKLSSYLAFMLGYTLEIEELGQYLRFDQNSEYLAPHKPKLFLDYAVRKQTETLQMEYEEKLNESKVANENESEEKWKKYFESKMALLEQEYKDKLDQMKTTHEDE